MHNRLYNLIILIAFSSTYVNAQYLSVKGDFSVDQKRGCYDLTVTVTKLDPTPGVVIYLYEGWGSATSNSNTFTYTVPGDYWLYQIIPVGTGNKVDSLFMQILDPTVPDVELQTCNGNQLQLQIYDTDYDIYEIDFGDGSPLIQQPVNTTPAPHSYGAAGSYLVTVTGMFTTAVNSCGVFSQTFSPVPVVQPAYISELTALDDGSVRLSYNLAPHSISRLEISVNDNNNFQVLKDLTQGTTIDTIANLNLASAVYCFRITTYDGCSNFRAYSNNVCSVRNAIVTIDNAIDLSWQTFVIDVNQTQQITRNGSPLVNLPAATSTFSDTTVICNSNYCYRVQETYPDGSVSISTEQCGTAISSDVPTPATDISSVNSDTQVNWQWLTDTVNLDKTFIYQVSETGQTSLLDTTRLTNYTYIRSDTSKQCINLLNVNICGNPSSPSLTGCTLNLEGTANNDGSVTLNWNRYQGWQSGVLEYIVVVLDQNGNVSDSISVGNVTTFTDPIEDADDQVSTYKVYAIPLNPAVSNSRSQLVTIERLPVISIPNVFTPNGDGLNDYFQASGKFIESVEMIIFNRWGSSIFHSFDAEGWDGRVKGSPVQLSNYTYKLSIKDFLGNAHIRSGTVLILSD